MDVWEDLFSEAVSSLAGGEDRSLASLGMTEVVR